MDPISSAKYLCDQAELTREQQGPVSLIALKMQQVYIKEVARQNMLTTTQRQAEGTNNTDVVRLPLVGRRLRLLFYGGGGCGETRIITHVLAKLLRFFTAQKA